ncbi:MAG: hypothetical protein QM626_09680 [Microbacterium sp.]
MIKIGGILYLISLGIQAILTAALPQFVSPAAGATWAQLLAFESRAR